LKPNGLAATWIASERVRRTFIHVFPHVLELRDVMLGSNEPIVIDRPAIAARLAAPDVQLHYEGAATHIKRIIDYYLQPPLAYGPDYVRTGLTPINTDLDPRDEFDLGLRP